MFCSLYKWLLSNALDHQTSPSPRVLRHIERCADCRRFYETARMLEAALTAQAADATAEARSVRVDCVFDAAGPVGFTSVVSSRKYLAAAAVITVAAVAAVHYHVSRPRPPRPEYIEAVQVLENIRAASRTVVGPIAQEPTPIGITSAAQKPLTAELDAITRNARSAIAFLVDCTPVSLAESSSRRMPD